MRIGESVIRNFRVLSVLLPLRGETGGRGGEKKRKKKMEGSGGAGSPPFNLHPFSLREREEKEGKKGGNKRRMEISIVVNPTGLRDCSSSNSGKKKEGREGKGKEGKKRGREVACLHTREHFTPLFSS